MKIGIIGCGFIGAKRSAVIAAHPEHELVICADVILDRAQKLARDYAEKRTTEVIATADWNTVVDNEEVELILVSAVPNMLAKMVKSCVDARKPTLVDKPAGCNAAEIRAVAELAKEKQASVRVGFNHRYHPAMQQARRIIDAGTLGKLMYIRGRYGHGGRLGYEKEWRANRDIAGGGELIDQGTHLIDLSRWFLGDFVDVNGFATTQFWDMDVEDNGFMMLKTSEQQVAWLHASWTEWKNLFCLEIFGKDAKIQIDGLGGSYGVEQLTLYEMLPEMGPPKISKFEYPEVDRSFETEFLTFVDDIKAQRASSPDLGDAAAAMEIVEKIYQLSRGKSFAK